MENRLDKYQIGITKITLAITLVPLLLKYVYNMSVSREIGGIFLLIAFVFMAATIIINLCAFNDKTCYIIILIFSINIFFFREVLDSNFKQMLMVALYILITITIIIEVIKLFKKDKQN